MKTKVFLSHASEDKSFARPLYNELNKPHDVWYDEYALNVGESIFESISRGLRECDYGVVVLSQNFFAKKWTNAELQGLFALETELRKVILPVWLGVQHKDVLQFSPILADRVAALADDGVEAVAKAINAAISAAAIARNQERRIRSADRLIALGNAVGQQERSDALLNSERGMTIVREELVRIFEIATGQLAQVVQQTPALGLALNKGGGSIGKYINLNGPNGLIQRFDFKTPFNNTSSRDQIKLSLLRYRDEYSGERTSTLKEGEYAPFITTQEEVKWKNEDGLFDGPALIEIALADFIQQLERVKQI